MKIKEMTNIELIQELENIYNDFLKYKGCVVSRTKTRTLAIIKNEIYKRMK